MGRARARQRDDLPTVPAGQSLGLSAEQAFDERLSAQAEVLSDVTEDAGQRANPEGRVKRDGDVVLTAFESGQPTMARFDGLPGSPGQRAPSRDRRRRRPAAVSSGDDFLAYEVEPDDLGELSFIEVAADGISDLVVQVRGPVGFGEDGLSEGLGGEAAFWGLLDEEDQLRHAAALL
jgi:hypothetical protein